MLMSVALNNPSPRKHYLIETEDENSEDEVSKTPNQLPKHYYKALRVIFCIVLGPKRRRARDKT